MSTPEKSPQKPLYTGRHAYNIRETLRNQIEVAIKKYGDKLREETGLDLDRIDIEEVPTFGGPSKYYCHISLK